MCVYLCRVEQGVQEEGRLEGGWVSGWVGGWVVAVVLGPQHSGSSLSSRNLSFYLIRQCREHVRLWHMLAKVTNSLCLPLNFWPLEKSLPTLMTPSLLHQVPWTSALPAVSLLLFVRADFVSHTTAPNLKYFSSLNKLKYEETIIIKCLNVFRYKQNYLVFYFSRCQSRGQFHHSPQVNLSTSQANLTFRCPTHTY